MQEAALEFQKIHDEFRPKIQRYLLRMVGEFEAEDLTQEVFARVYRGLPSFRGESKLSTWIYRIATNLALDRLRDPAIKHIAQDDQLDNPEAGEEDTKAQELWTGEAAALPEQQVFRQQRYDCYRDFIEKLPPNYRAVVALSELAELPAIDIAEILGLSLQVVKIRLHRGRARLLQELKAHCHIEDWL